MTKTQTMIVQSKNVSGKDGITFTPDKLYAVVVDATTEKSSIDYSNHLSNFVGKQIESVLNQLFNYEPIKYLYKICPKPIGKGYDAVSNNCAVLMGYFIKDEEGKHYFHEAAGFVRKSIPTDSETTIETKENKEFMQLHRFYESLFPNNMDAWNQWKKRVALGFQSPIDEKYYYNFHWTKALLSSIDNKKSLFMSPKLETQNINDAIVLHYETILNA